MKRIEPYLKQESCKRERAFPTLPQGAAFLVGGVSSNFRLGIAPTPVVFDHADGPYLIDVDGNRLIYYYLGLGPMILGHTPPGRQPPAARGPTCPR